MSKSNSLTLSRRELLVSMSAVAAAGVLGVTTEAHAQAGATTGVYKSDLRKAQIYQGCCAPECLGHSLQFHVVDGKVIRVHPTKREDDFAFTTGCARGMSRMQALTDPGRTMRPLKRVRKDPAHKGPLGINGDRFISISWEQAISEISHKLKALVTTEGEKGWVVSVGSGNQGPVCNNATVAFFDYLEKPRVGFSGSLCCVAVGQGMTDVFGIRHTDTRETIRDSKYILNWSNNPAVTSPAFWKFFGEAKRKGAKIAVIDPRFSESCSIADQWLPLNPGTDLLIGIGMIKYIINNNLHDADFIISRTNAPLLIDVTDVKNPYTEAHKSNFYQPDGKFKMVQKGIIIDATENNGKSQSAAFDVDSDLNWEGTVDNRRLMTAFRFMRHIYAGEALGVNNKAGENKRASDLFDQNYTMANIAKTTGVSKEEIEKLARDYATAGGTNSKKAMIIQNMSGAQRLENGVANVIIQSYLPLLTGQIGQPGNGIDDTGGFNNTGVADGTGSANAVAGPPVVMMGKQPEFYIPRTDSGIRQVAAHTGNSMKSVDNDDIVDPKVHFWWIQSTSVYTQFPDTAALKEAAKYIDCIVSAKPIRTTDSDMADYVLPTTAVGETWDISSTNRNNYAQISEKAVEPYGEAKSDMQIMRMMAKEYWSGDDGDSPVTFVKDGITYNKIEQFDKDDYEFAKQCLHKDDGTPRSVGGVTWKRLIKEKVVRPTHLGYPIVPFQSGIFDKTPLGRARFYYDRYNKDGGPNSSQYRIDRSANPARALFRSPVARYVPAYESQLPLLPQYKADKQVDRRGVNIASYRDKFPLMAVQVKTSISVHASFTAYEWINEAYGTNSKVMIHPSDAKARSINDGDIVTVFNARGKAMRVAKVSEFVKKGVVTLENGWWDRVGNGSSSYITNNECEPVSKGHMCNTTLVDVKKGWEA